MNELNPDPGPIDTASSALPYYDRSMGLVIFGVMTILLGLLIGLFVPITIFGQSMAARSGSAPMGFSIILPALVLYGGLSVVLVWLGIGSILARRWARALLLIFSWSWLGLGIFEIVAMAFVMPGALANAKTASGRELSPAATDAVLIPMFVALAVIFLILPGVWTFFYSSRHVRLTCEWRDSVIRWTDRCPLPVLGLCLWLVFSIVMMLILPFSMRGAAPFFGMFITGIPGTVFYFALAALWAYAAWLLYRLDPLGWWTLLIAMLLFGVSTVVTYAQHDIVELYQLMGFPQAQIDQIKNTGMFAGSRMAWFTGFSMLPIFLYLLFIRKYFRRSI